MNTVTEKAYAKVNLTLGVLYKRPDGYHALDSLMQTVDLYDTVTIEKSTGITVTVSGAVLPYKNTLRTAAEAFYGETGLGASIHVNKRIPSEAGMGGGSADGAAVLRGLNRLYDYPLPAYLLPRLALKVGADVPFLLKGGLQRAQGVGEILTPLPYERFYLVLAKPAAGVSTKDLFTSLKLPLPRPDTLAAAKAIAAGDGKALAPLLFNAMEEAAVSVLPEIGSLKRTLLSLGALNAVMTGSGSTVFGLFATEEEAETAAAYLKGLVPFVHVCRTV